MPFVSLTLATGGHSVPVSSALSPHWLAIVLAISNLALPVIVGAGVGWLFRRWRKDRLTGPHLAPVLYGLAVVVPIALPGSWFVTGAWDMGLMLLLAALGFVWSAHEQGLRFGRNELLLLLGGTVVAAVGIEIGYGQLSSATPRYYPRAASEVRLFIDPFWINGCGSSEMAQLPYPERFPEVQEERLLNVPDRPERVLHVGDSMIFGNPSREAQTYVKMLNGLDETRAHINAGLPDTGLDYQFLLAGNWSAQLDVDAVVVHFNTSGDIMDMDRQHCFCGGGQLLDYQGDSVTPRCPQAQFATDYWSRFTRSPPPYFLRVLAQSSLSAQALCGEFRRVQTRTTSGVNRQVAMDHMLAIFRTMATHLERQGIAFRVVYLPDRASVLDPHLSHGDRQRPEDRVVLNYLAELGVVVYDPYVPFATAISQNPAGRWFTNRTPGDKHFDIDGHAFMAQWLAETISF